LTVRIAANNESEASEVPVATKTEVAKEEAKTPVEASQVVQAAAKEDVPVQAIEPVTPQKAQAEPVVAAEAAMTVKPEGSSPEGGDVRRYFGKLPGKSAGGDPEIAWDIKSTADAEVLLKRFAEEIAKKDEELKKKDGELGAMKGELDAKKKEDKLTGLLACMKKAGIDPKEVEKLKPELTKLDESAIGIFEKVLKLVGEEEEGEPDKKPPFEKKPDGAPAGGGLPPFMKKAASQDDLVRAASNIPQPSIAPEDTGNLAELANNWIALDRKKELQQIPA